MAKVGELCEIGKERADDGRMDAEQRGGGGWRRAKGDASKYHASCVRKMESGGGRVGE
jgi:hypothetical protein